MTLAFIPKGTAEGESAVLFSDTMEPNTRQTITLIDDD